MLVSMKYTNLGQSGLKVSRICLGTNNFGGQVSEETAIKITDEAIDCGINVIDTANTYAEGKSEKIIGKAIKGHRDEVVIATKVGFGNFEKPNQSGLSRKHILSQIEHSLISLQTDYIDIYYMHRYDPDTPLQEALRTLDNLVRQGKIRYVACSNFTFWQIAKAMEICETHDLEKIVAVQPPYNLLQRDIEQNIIPYCQQEHLGILTYTPLMGGFLTGKYSKDMPPPTGSRFKYNPRLWKRASNASNFKILKQIKEVAKDARLPVSKLALSWILKNPAITAPIVGASTVEQVKENCQISEINLSDEIYKTLNKLTQGRSFSLYW
jgi:aryl-alcohol dehydrogenase-like predicted oxidoreductase